LETEPTGLTFFIWGDGVDATVAAHAAAVISAWSRVELEIADVANAFLSGNLAGAAALLQGIKSTIATPERTRLSRPLRR
jgi:hypothetical protein